MTTIPEFTELDHAAMERALALAGRGLETAHPNPRVGCVITAGGRIVGEGWHERTGEAHAEAIALRAAGGEARGATAYVTLEPCSHFGRTPPCTDDLIRAGVRRVVFAVRDPNPKVDGKGAERLLAAGITVQTGLLQDEATEINAGYFKRMQHGVPWVRVKVATSLDGRTALADGASQWITSEAAREDVQHWRARSSAVMTGIGTILADDPRLDVRLTGESRRHPLRVVLDGRLRTPPRARLFEGFGETLILTRADASRDAIAALEARGARVERLPDESNTRDGRINPAAALQRLAELGVNELHVESGATLTGALLSADVIDELLVYLSPKILGSGERPLAQLEAFDRLDESGRFSFREAVCIGPDVRLTLRRCTSETEA